MTAKIRFFVFSSLLCVSAFAWPISVCAEEQPSTQASFASAADAANSFKAALATRDPKALLDIFGHDHEDLIVGDDPATTRAEQRRVNSLAHQRMSLTAVTDSKVIVVLGVEKWPLPIPIVRDNGRWKFDTAAGEHEILARRIGRDELAAIAALRTFVRAQKEYAARRRSSGRPVEYASFVMSTPGQTDGLWWDAATAAKAGPSPLAQFAGQQKEFLAGRQPGDPYQGYYFRILTGQGAAALGGAKSYIENGRMTKGFAMVAWPAYYRTTGIMTFIVGQAGKVFRKDLGQETSSLVDTIQIFDPDRSWTPEAP